jgi:hypothetical protein
MPCSRQPFFIDSNIFDKIADERGAASLVGRLVGRNVIELLVTHIQIDEIVATPDAARRKHLLISVPYREVPTHGALYDGRSTTRRATRASQSNATLPQSSDETRPRTP